MGSFTSSAALYVLNLLAATPAVVAVALAPSQAVHVVVCWATRVRSMQTMRHMQM